MEQARVERLTAAEREECTALARMLSVHAATIVKLLGKKTGQHLLHLSSQTPEQQVSSLDSLSLLIQPQTYRSNTNLAFKPRTHPTKASSAAERALFCKAFGANVDAVVARQVVAHLLESGTLQEISQLAASGAGLDDLDKQEVSCVALVFLQNAIWVVMARTEDTGGPVPQLEAQLNGANLLKASLALLAAPRSRSQAGLAAWPSEHWLGEFARLVKICAQQAHCTLGTDAAVLNVLLGASESCWPKGAPVPRLQPVGEYDPRLLMPEISEIVAMTKETVG